MAPVTVPLDFRGRKLPFMFPNSGNMGDHLRSILAGKDYPLPPLPADFHIATVVDVGANVGAAALWFLGAAPEARVVCFEPSRQNHDCLVHNLAAFPNAEAHRFGLFSDDREISLHLGASQCMQHSIYSSGETGTATETVVLRDAAAQFDALGVDRVSILKIDTEGCEVPILERLGGRLDAVDILYLEWHSDDDRRRVDALLAPRFLLAHAVATFPHRGNACYLAREVAARVPAIEQTRIGD